MKSYQKGMQVKVLWVLVLLESQLDSGLQSHIRGVAKPPVQPASL
jgi:hypothetical protein